MTAPETFDCQSARSDFPILQTEVRGKPLTYLDNAATAQKPQRVLDALGDYYAAENANIHRGVHYLSEMATDAYEATRAKLADMLHLPDPDEVIFTRGATESINVVAHGFTATVLQPGDEILITHMEHHANIVPWQIACQRTGAVLKIVPVDEAGLLDMEAFSNLLSERTKLVSVVHCSNSLGTINPIKEIVAQAHARDVPVLVDGAQSVPHAPVDVADIGCDFFVFSGHKLFGPTGIGFLWGRREWLERFPPYQSGGDMIERVDFEGTTYKAIPGKFEAGTPHIAGVIGLSAAVDYLNGLDRAGALAHEQMLLQVATEKLSAIDGLRILGTAPEKAAVISFLIEGVHPHDIGTFLDADGVAIRAGHHCTQPLLKRYGVPATARASFAFYNNLEDVDRLTEAVLRMQRFFT
ncbi:MAG: cysteine desulfurase [Coraliomargaritaceae bacterium]